MLTLGATMNTSLLPTVEVNSYSQIQEFIRRLGPPIQGRKRVLRGQNKNYVEEKTGLLNLLPALAREKSDHTYDPAWLVSIQMYSMRVDEHGASTPLDQVYTWGPALLQHYGPGSAYLDVTSDLDVALWFALYKRHEKWLATRQLDRMLRSQCFAWYTDPSLTDVGIAPVLYVFDAPCWNGEGSPAHGELVELTTLNTAGKLPQEARRLHQQIASLLYADIKRPEGPNLGAEVVAMARLGPNFQKSTVPSYGWSVTELFPPPSSDPFYKALLEVPAQIQFDPTRLEHPLTVPCYLAVAPELPTDEVKGKRQTPLELSASDADEIVGLDAFAALGKALQPDLMFGFAVAGNSSFGEPMIPTTAEGNQFRLKDATPFLLEGPLWSYLPSCHTEESRGEWIQSALPIGIAPVLAKRPTDNVYIEMSTVDVLYPEKEAGAPRDGSAVRGIWTVRSGNRYWCTVYRTGDGGVFSHAVEFRFIPHVGQFVRVAPEKENELTQGMRDKLQPHFDVAEKALFTTLLLLRELSPGFKPPSAYSAQLKFEDGSYARMVGVVLEPQLGLIHTPASAPFLVPRALNGSTYARASGADAIDRDAWKKSDEGFAALMNAFRQVKDSFYLMDAGAELANLYGERNQFPEALEVVRYALASADTVPVSPYTKTFAAILEVLLGRTLYCLNDRPNSLKAFQRAMKIQQECGDQAKLMETRNLVNRLFPPPIY
jgi:FRG domain